MLASKNTAILNSTTQGHPRPNRKAYGLVIDHRKGSWMAKADRTHCGIGRRSVSNGAPAEHLRPRIELAMDLESDGGDPTRASLG